MLLDHENYSCYSLSSFEKYFNNFGEQWTQTCCTPPTLWQDAEYRWPVLYRAIAVRFALQSILNSLRRKRSAPGQSRHFHVDSFVFTNSPKIEISPSRSLQLGTSEHPITALDKHSRGIGFKVCRSKVSATQSSTEFGKSGAVRIKKSVSPIRISRREWPYQTPPLPVLRMLRKSLVAESVKFFWR